MNKHRGNDCSLLASDEYRRWFSLERVHVRSITKAGHHHVASVCFGLYFENVVVVFDLVESVNDSIEIFNGAGRIKLHAQRFEVDQVCEQNGDERMRLNSEKFTSWGNRDTREALLHRCNLAEHQIGGGWRCVWVEWNTTAARSSSAIRSVCFSIRVIAQRIYVAANKHRTK